MSSDAKPPEGPPRDWVELVRGECWREALEALESLPEAERNRPALRFVRARVQSELGAAGPALELLTDLERELPELAPAIAELRGRAALNAGQFEQAVAYFSRQSGAPAELSLAEAELGAGRLGDARSAADRAVALLHDSRRVGDDRVRAHALRARIAQKQADPHAAAADLRWLLKQAPLEPEAAGAEAVLATLAPQSPLSPAERLARARVFADAGRVEATEHELSRATEQAQSIPAGSATFLRASALYNARSDYPRAAELFERAARQAPARAAEAQFYAARSLSRAELDDRAVVGYEALAQRFPSSSWAEQALYLAARVRFSAGRYSAAERLYAAYLSRFGKHARFQDGASYERALCWLENGDAAKAASAFGAMSARASDARSGARTRHLEGVALALANRKADAAERFRRVVREAPLSFFALAAAARLQHLGEPPPEPIGPGPAAGRTPLELNLPPRVTLLAGLGLDSLAEHELAVARSSLGRIYAPRSVEALCELYGKLDVAAQRFRLAQSSVRARVLENAPAPTTRWAWECLYPEPYGAEVRTAAQREALPAALLWAMMRQESGFDPRALSPAGAVGLLQLLPETARRVAALQHEPFAEASLTHPAANIRTGAHYLHLLLSWLDGNVALAAAGYNAGPEAVFRWLAAKPKLSLDLFVAHIPFGETRDYVERVFGNYARYALLMGGSTAVPKLDLNLPQALPRPEGAF